MKYRIAFARAAVALILVYDCGNVSTFEALTGIWNMCDYSKNYRSKALVGLNDGELLVKKEDVEMWVNVQMGNWICKNVSTNDRTGVEDLFTEIWGQVTVGFSSN